LSALARVKFRKKLLTIEQAPTSTYLTIKTLITIKMCSVNSNHQALIT